MLRDLGCLVEVGGVAVIYRQFFLQTRELSSFEILIFCVNKHQPILFLLVYRPPKPNDIFISEFSDLLCLNISICCPSDAVMQEFIKLLRVF